jgi:4-hydroxy-3-methylbut-2-enyl diphosphate reductase
VGARAFLVDDVSEVDPAWLEGVAAVGVTSGASAPEFLVDAMVAWLGQRGATDVREVTVIDEDVFFPLPPELVELQRSREKALNPA